jgi:holo-[acyl-carrier protein] synthase
VPYLVGMDLVDVVEVEESLTRFGDTYLQRVFTPREVAACGGDARRLAACFAAKEAVAKTFDAGDEALDWRSIEVLAAPDGTVTAELAGHSSEIAARAGIGGLQVSVTAADKYAVAVVLAEREDTRRRSVTEQ